MNDNTSLCYFHPKEVVIGVCALCLNERLLVLASKQEKKIKTSKTRDQNYYSFLSAEKKNKDHDHHQSRIHYLPKMFALSSLLTRLDIRHARKVEEIIHDDASSICSYEDSYISIKFENNGVASWEKGGAGTVPKVSLKHCDNMSNWSRSSSKEGKGGAVIGHAKPRMQLRWRKRIGHIFQLIRLKRSSTTKLEGVKVRHGWIRTLTKRKTKE